MGVADRNTDRIGQWAVAEIQVQGVHFAGDRHVPPTGLGLAHIDRDAARPGGPSRQQDASEIRDQLRQGLAKVSPKAAEIFALRYFEGYGNHEIAQMLGTSRSTGNVILHRTRGRLREEIGAYVGEEQ